MELQAIRYSAMVSTLTYNRVINIYTAYLEKEKIEGNAEDNLLEFLEWDTPREENFALDVRIILVSANFSKEITTTVLWLNDRNLDIRCIRLKPYKFEGNILIDVQQVIPLPEAQEYQVKLREKAKERRQAGQSSRDFTKYRFKGEVYNKRNLVRAVVKTWFKEENPETYEELVNAFPKKLRNGRMFTTYEKAEKRFSRRNIPRHFLEKEDTFKFSDSSEYVVSNQWGIGNIDEFIERARELGYKIEEIK